MTHVFFLLAAGFVLLVVGGNYLIKGGGRLSALLGVSPLLIGLGVAAFGTSAPEAAVSIEAAINNHSAVSIGNVLGSNIANIGLAIGLALLFFGMEHPKRNVWKEVLFGLLATVLLFLLSLISPFRYGQYGLSRLAGLVLLIFFSGYLFYLFRMSLSDKKSMLFVETEQLEHRPLEYVKSVAMAVGGIAGVVWGGDLVVKNAVTIAEYWGVSQTLISVTIVALGTSLPEIVVSVLAVRKDHWDMALGNILGSNLFNILFVLGATATIQPIEFANFGKLVLPDMVFALFITAVLYLMLMYNRGKPETTNTRTRLYGVLLLLIYLAYVLFAVVRR